MPPGILPEFFSTPENLTLDEARRALGISLEVFEQEHARLGTLLLGDHGGVRASPDGAELRPGESTQPARPTQRSDGT